MEESKAQAKAPGSHEYHFTKEQCDKLSTPNKQEIIKNFRNYDANGDEHIDVAELRQLLVDLGEIQRKDGQEKIAEQVQAFLDKYDSNKDGQISWEEFCDMMLKLKGAGIKWPSEQDKQDTAHKVSHDECVAFANTLNAIMVDKNNKPEPWWTEIEGEGEVKSENLIYQFTDGQVMCHMLRKVDPDSILEKAINTGANLSIYKIKENCSLGINAAKAMGIKLIGIDYKNFVDNVPHMVLTFVWQIVRHLMTQKIDLMECPNLWRLLEEGEDINVLRKMKPEDILIRWINYHLKEAGQDRRIANLGGDLKDSFALTHLLHQLDASKCPLSPLDEADPTKKAQKMIDSATALGVPKGITQPVHIVKSNVKINTLFCSYIFNTKHGLKDVDKSEFDPAGLLDDDVKGSQEERQYRMWINSLNIDGVDVSDLYDDVKSGWLLCKVADKIEPGSVDWKMVKDPNDKGFNNFQAADNNGEFIKACKNKMGEKMIAIGGAALTQGNKIDTLSSCWALCKSSYKKLIGEKTEADLIAWANERVGDKHAHIVNTKDKALSDGHFLMHLLASIEDRAVAWDIMKPADECKADGGADEDAKKAAEDAKANNAKYVLSVARKLNCLLFCVWDQIVSVHQKQIFILLCTIYELSTTYKAVE